MITEEYNIMLKNNISYKRRHSIEHLGTENIWIELTPTCNKKMFVGLLYRPPNTHADIDQSIVNSILLAYNTVNDNIVILGDFNLNSSIVNSRRKLESLCNQFSLIQCIQESTHYIENSQSILDLILVNNVCVGLVNLF